MDTLDFEMVISDKETTADLKTKGKKPGYTHSLHG